MKSSFIFFEEQRVPSLPPKTTMKRMKTLFFLSTLLAVAAAVEDAVFEAGEISWFQQYLQINTAHPSPDYHAAVQFLESVASSIAGIRSETIEFVPGKPLLLLTWPGRDPSLPAVLLYSHTDVVPAKPSKWSHLDMGTGRLTR
ncbi:hypothetical protein J5N97_026162 [Dioscorea zingiberensis]|uniref:Aminoacylase-1 n=1 Tax=Dioscorea zingiberensis TaxID=325984 RepID=A0A9D5C262_9LILI|nr:hypothetical protein J5N97_026162 [Dioscorea zingiberensis]